MVRRFALAIGLAIGVGSVHGAFVGIQVVEGDSAAASVAIGASAITFQLFAVFDGPGGNPNPNGANIDNTVLSFGFSNINTTGLATFFQEGAPFGSDLAPNSGLFGISPTLQYDTYGTIGVSDALDPNSGFISKDPNGVMTTTHIGGGWFNNNPFTNAGSATANTGVSTGFGTLLFQMTVLTNGGPGNFASINSLISGSLTIFTQGIGVANPHFVTIPTPTPGPLALFGVAGLAAMRRRR